LLVIAALSPRTLLHRAHVPGARTLALWSYSIYLIHKPVGNIVGKLASRWELAAPVTLVATTMLSLAVGALLYKLVEQPFMRLRDRLAPSNFAPVAITAAVLPSHAKQAGVKNTAPARRAQPLGKTR